MCTVQVFCDLGTDCSDCGPWMHLHLRGEEIATPVAALSAMGIDVFTRHTRTVPSFIMPFTNPKHDVDVSGQMHVNGHIEIGLTQVFHVSHDCLIYPALQCVCTECPWVQGCLVPSVLLRVTAVIP